MLERFTRERQRASKSAAFHLEDEADLTHYGQSLSKLDDFADVGLELDSDEEEAKGSHSILVSLSGSDVDFSQVRLTVTSSRSHTLVGSKVRAKMRMKSVCLRF
jgi:hypothetical protein